MIRKTNAHPISKEWEKSRGWSWISCWSTFDYKSANGQLNFTFSAINNWFHHSRCWGEIP